MSKLLSPYTIRGVVFKNRIVMSPMCMYSCEQQDGIVTDWHLVHYATRAVGQVGLIIVEATAVSPEGRITNHDLGIWDDEQVGGLKKLVDIVHQNGSKIGIQLGHAGRKSQADDVSIAPSAIAFNENYRLPEAMTISQIKEIITSFRQAALRAKSAGFDVLEIHAAHGYLLNQFLSPLTNHRQDAYGGDPEGRYRIVKEVIEAIREIWSGPLFIRVSAEEYHPDGLTTQDYVQFCQRMKQDGVDLIDVSSGAVIPANISVYPGYQVPYADQIRNQVDVPTSAVGLITSAEHAEEILQNDRADLIMLGRVLLREPYWVRTAAYQLSDPLQKIKQYERGW